MQGINDFIPTHLKVEYLNALLKCGFDRSHASETAERDDLWVAAI